MILGVFDCLHCPYCDRLFNSTEAVNQHLWAKHKEHKLPAPPDKDPDDQST